MKRRPRTNLTQLQEELVNELKAGYQITQNMSLSARSGWISTSGKTHLKKVVSALKSLGAIRVLRGEGWESRLVLVNEPVINDSKQKGEQNEKP